jgi:hypothetical protein
MKKATKCFKVFLNIQYSLEYFQIYSIGIKKCVMIMNITPSFTKPMLFLKKNRK